MIIYQGPSQIEPEVEIVGIITGTHDPSSNSKTGRLAQLWIMRTDIQHGRTLRTGLDSAVCGACPFTRGRGCYVTAMPTSSIFRSFRRGHYGSQIAPADAARVLQLQHRRGVIDGLRLGAYGDPVALPLPVVTEVVSPLLEAGAVVTGYTHAWRAAYRLETQPEPDLRWRTLVMASCHHTRDVEAARAGGWRVFTVFAPAPKGVDPYDWGTQEARKQGVALCPASAERPEQIRMTCARCGGCDGSRGPEDRRVGFGLAAHGSGPILNAARSTMKKGIA